MFQQAKLKKSIYPELENKDLGEEVLRLREELTQKSNQISNLQDHNKRQGDQLKLQEGQLHRHHDLLKREQETIRKQQDQLVKQGAIVRQAQEQKQRELQEARRFRFSDENTRGKLETLAGAVQSFNRSNSIELTSVQSLATSFHGRQEEAAAILKHEAWMALAAPRLEQRGSRLLLEANLNLSICRSILLIPFNFLDGMRDDMKPGAATQLYQVIWKLEKGE